MLRLSGRHMRHSCAFLFFWFLCPSAFPQQIGTIQCDPGTAAEVPAWIAPGQPYVLKQLSCGQLVTFIGWDSSVAVLEYSSRSREYAKIQIGDKVAYVESKHVRLLDTQNRLPVDKGDSLAAERQSAKPAAKEAKEAEEQEKWNLIKKENLRFSDEKLLSPIYANGPRTFKATLSNNTELKVSHLHLLVRLYDCSGKPNSDYSNCEIIGEVKSVVPASVPPGQTRGVVSSMLFEATPRVKGTFAWGYWLLGVRAE
jgi:hypothetical protein